MTVSAVVPARELTDLGRRCLAHLLELPDVEVVFVPDKRPPDLDARVVCVPSGPAPAGAKRQLGLERSSGDVIALIDDDAYPHASWLDQALAAFAADPDVVAVCGPTLTPPDDPELEQLGGRVYATPLVGGPHRWRYEPRDARDVDDAPSVNLLLRREEALAVRLDSPFYPGDDTIVCDRIVRRGGRIRYVPGAIVYHSRRPLWGPHLRQVWRFGRRRGAFARRFRGNSLRPAYFAPSLLVLGLALGGLHPRTRGVWEIALAGYGAAVVVSAADRDVRRFVRVAVAIPATHVAYGVGFLLGIGGLPLPEE